MNTCEDCGCRVYARGCVNCNEAAYIDEQRAELGMESCADARRRDESVMADDEARDASPTHQETR